ncbi:hypothetical protein [Actinomadura rugatobispora]|uniref:Uncharacterized protein n=1 Tax=Actinomadura rugatobispora TaxID=1994 RepID=A0ABW0ZZ12_9ACTN|nr:hypothetical protein GCM10010200_098990 [Actinomadura rugatobispora]
MTRTQTTEPPTGWPLTAAAVFRALSAFQTTADDLGSLNSLEDESYKLRRSELVRLLEALDQSRAVHVEILSSLEGVRDWVPGGEETLYEAVNAMRVAGESLHELLRDLAPDQRA